MRAVSFAKVIVATAGTPVQLGVSTLAAAMGAGDSSLTITSANPFSADMCPFVLTIDTGVNLEKVEISSISGTTFSISQRGAAGTKAQSHLTAVAACAYDYRIAGFVAGADDANVGKVYLGNRSMATGGSTGTIKRFRIITASSPDDTIIVMWNGGNQGNLGNLTEFKTDVATSNDGLNFCAWVR